jgi:membrane fusion protein (multidrug efflux system)
LTSIVVALLAAACSEHAPPPAQTPAPAPAEVRIVVARPEAVPDIVEVPARVQAFRAAEVRARVDGIVQRRLYDEGSDVSEGQKLFLIDPREMQAAVGVAKAALSEAEAAAANARQNAERYEGLVARQAISEQAYDAALADLRTAQAQVEQARAELDRAQLNLSFTTVTAPIAGRAGRAQVTEGALVSASAATLLTTIEQFDPIYVNFSTSSAELLRVRREIAQGTLEAPRLQNVRVSLVLEDGSAYAHEGHLDFLDMTIDEQTGTAALRAEFPNPDHLLLPGQFVRARVEAGVRPNALLIPQRAVQLTAQGASVLVVGPENVVSSRRVEIGEMRGGSWMVLNGLEAGDRVIVDGVQKVQPGQPVRIAAADRRTAESPPTPADKSPQPPPADVRQ